MNKPNLLRKVSDLTALVNEIIAYWKAVAERDFKEAHPFADQNEFEQNWPKMLDSFFLAETLNTTKLLQSLSSIVREN